MTEQEGNQITDEADSRDGSARPVPVQGSLQDVRPNRLTVQQACRLSRKDRLDFLMQFNEMSEPVVVGQIRAQPTDSGTTYWLDRLQTLDGRALQLPLIERSRLPGVPLGRNQTLPDGALASLRITVVPDNHREVQERGKPFAMQAVGDAERLRPLLSIATDSNGKVLIPKSVWDSELEAITKPLAHEKERIQAEINQTQAAKEQELRGVCDQIETKKELFLSINDALSKLAEERQQLDKELHRKQSELDSLKTRKEQLMSAYRHLCEFAKERSAILLDLDLISKDQHEVLLNEAPQMDQPKDMLSWQDDLSMDYNRAVSTIHAYMLNQGIIYPRWLVANFLTLLRTNDLIVLSGLSGAGKTQIVRSFAEALGGVAHVMPVKPNWTGAEDLLGFFNPLQRTYVRTPFLEALLAATKDPNRLHLICLDEMNLARAEYYFADFLSALEDRTALAEIPLYSESEASHIQAEVRMLLAAFHGSGLLSSPTELKQEGVSLDHLLLNPETMTQIRAMFGENAAESFPAFHGRVRRALSTMLDIPATVLVPANVRFIGAINVDQTTYALSPKILDRAHVIRFENPLKYSIADVRAEVERHMGSVPRVAPIYMPSQSFMPQRSQYPEYSADHPAAKWMQELYTEYLIPLGLDIAYRTIRQSQLYWDLLKDVLGDNDTNHEAAVKNLLVLQKILPKFTLDGKVKAAFRDNIKEGTRFDVVKEMEQVLRETAEASQMHPNMHDELRRVRMAAETNDKIFNYWA